MKLKVRFTILLLFVINGLKAQTVQEIEIDLFKNLQKIQDFGYDRNYDSLSVYNEIFSNKLVKYASSSKDMLLYDFPNIAQNYWSIATSPDGKFRIYSWDTYTGGSMHFYCNVFQWTDYGELYAQKNKNNEDEDADPNGSYSVIYQLTDELNTFYMPIYNAVYSGRDSYQALYCMDFEREKLDTEFKKIKTKSGITHKLGFAFDFFSVKNIKEIPVKLIRFDKSTYTLSIPVVTTAGLVTNKKITYEYDGDYFVKLTPKYK